MQYEMPIKDFSLKNLCNDLITISSLSTSLCLMAEGVLVIWMSSSYLIGASVGSSLTTDLNRWGAEKS